MKHSLLTRTALAFFLLVVVFQLLLVVTSMRWVMLPLAHSSAADLARLIHAATERYVAADETTRRQVARDVLNNDALEISSSKDSAVGEASWLPYVYVLKDELAQRFARPLDVVWDARDARYRVDVPVGEAHVVVSFSHERIGTSPGVSVVIMLLVSIALSLLAALWLAHYLNRPLLELQTAAQQLGRGGSYEPIPETGPSELAQLARRINQLAEEVHSLMQDRTTLLAGISHDLRTPLSRLRIGLELLRTEPDPKLHARLERYLDEMTDLISSFLDFSRGVVHEPAEDVDLDALLRQIANDANQREVRVAYADAGPVAVRVPTLALTRVLNNLLENALRYGAGKPVELGLERSAGGLVIEVRDRGPGIPADQRDAIFRPFVRLDPSRNSATGGSGLGLAIAKQIAIVHDWVLQLDDRPGGGTVARVLISSRAASLRRA